VNPKPKHVEVIVNPKPKHVDAPASHIEVIVNPKPKHVEVIVNPKPKHVEVIVNPKPKHVEVIVNPKPKHIEVIVNPKPKHVEVIVNPKPKPPTLDPRTRNATTDPKPRALSPCMQRVPHLVSLSPFRPPFPTPPSLLTLPLTHSLPFPLTPSRACLRQVIEHKQGTKGKIILVVRDESGKTEL
jgi:hypothetical protein